MVGIGEGLLLCPFDIFCEVAELDDESLEVSLWEFRVLDGHMLHERHGY